MFTFLSLFSTPYRPNRNNHVDHNASIDADFLKEVPFGGVEIYNENFSGHICPQKLKKFLTVAQALNS